MKGSIAFIDGWWYIVINETADSLYCVCDNANNRYIYAKEDADVILTPLEAMRINGWDSYPEHNRELIENCVRVRSIPVEVMAEVMAGCQDDRFSDYEVE